MKIPEERQDAMGDATEIAQGRELEQMSQRLEKLAALSLCFAQRLDRQLSYGELYHYSRLVQEQVAAVLMYQKVARHWSSCHKQRATVLLDKALTSHHDLTNIAKKQCQLLAQKIEKVDLPRKNSAYSGCQTTGQFFDLKG